MRRVLHPLSAEELTPGSVFELRDGERVLTVTVPPGARYGTTLRVGELLVKLVPRAGAAVCAHDRVQHVLLSDDAVAQMVDQLVRSTREGVELAGSCRVRGPATQELNGLEDADSDRVWVIEGFEMTTRGSARQVTLGRDGVGPLDWHTHPGHGGFAGFSEADERAVKQRGRPLVVIGYTVLGPRALSTLAIPFGGWGLAMSLGLKAYVHAESQVQELEPRLLRLGAAARVRFPDGRTEPIRLADASSWRRAFEQASWKADQVATRAARAGEQVKQRLLRELQQRATRSS